MAGENQTMTNTVGRQPEYPSKALGVNVFLHDRGLYFFMIGVQMRRNLQEQALMLNGEHPVGY